MSSSIFWVLLACFATAWPCFRQRYASRAVFTSPHKSWLYIHREYDEHIDEQIQHMYMYMYMYLNMHTANINVYVYIDIFVFYARRHANIYIYRERDKSIRMWTKKLFLTYHYSQDWAPHLMPSCRPHAAMGLEASGGEPRFCLKKAVLMGWIKGKKAKSDREHMQALEKNRISIWVLFPHDELIVLGYGSKSSTPKRDSLTFVSRTTFVGLLVRRCWPIPCHISPQEQWNFCFQSHHWSYS